MFKFLKNTNVLREEIRQLKEELAFSERERKRYQHIAERDFLTDVYNRHGFMREAERFLHELQGELEHPGKRHSTIVTGVTIVFVDVDDLKKVNDVFGHKDGDLYLQLIARSLANTVRGIDFVGRWGGDEFVIALINADEKESLAVVQKLKQRINEIKLGDHGDDFTCSASFGFVVINNEQNIEMGHNLFDLIERADKAMYEAKIKRGKGSIVSFSELIG